MYWMHAPSQVFALLRVGELVSAGSGGCECQQLPNNHSFPWRQIFQHWFVVVVGLLVVCVFVLGGEIKFSPTF